MKKVKLLSNSCSTVLVGHTPGIYEVQCGDYGWDDGDLFIITNLGKLKLRHLKQLDGEINYV